MADAGIETFGVGEKFAYRVIGKMAGAGEDALFDDPGIGANLEHVEIVIGFEDEAIGLTKMDAHVIGEVAEIGADGDFCAVCAEGEGDRVCSIVRDGEGVDINVADGEALACLDGFDAAKASAEGIGEDTLQGVHGGFGDIERSFPKAEDLGEAVAMVGVFVSDQDGVEAIDFATDGGEAGEGFAFAEASVDENAGGLGFEQGEIARTAGREDGDAKTDGDAPGKMNQGNETLKIMAERWEGVNVEWIEVVEKTERSGVRYSGLGLALRMDRRGTGEHVPYKIYCGGAIEKGSRTARLGRRALQRRGRKIWQTSSGLEDGLIEEGRASPSLTSAFAMAGSKRRPLQRHSASGTSRLGGRGLV